MVFFHGYASDMEGDKAKRLEASCKRAGAGFVRFDCSGHGLSSHKITDGSLGIWLAEGLEVIKNTVGNKKFIAVGSSMGSWLMLLTALRMPDKVCGLIGIASAPDFSESLVWEKLTAQQKAELEQKGLITLKSPHGDYPITMRFIKEARRHLLMKKPLPITAPARLLHGMADEDAPYRLSVRIAERLQSGDVEVQLVKGADHRFSRPQDLETLEGALSCLIARARASRPRR